MARVYSDNVITELAVAIDDSTLTFTVSSGDGAKFPSLGVGDYYLVTFSDFPLETQWEIFRIESDPVGDVFTAVSRGDVNGPNGTFTWDASSRISMRVVAEDYDRLETTGGTGGPGFDPDTILTANGEVLVGAEGNVLTLEQPF